MDRGQHRREEREAPEVYPGAIALLSDSMTKAIVGTTYAGVGQGRWGVRAPHRSAIFIAWLRCVCLEKNRDASTHAKEAARLLSSAKTHRCGRFCCFGSARHHLLIKRDLTTATLSFSDLDAKMPSKASSQLGLTAAGGFIKLRWIRSAGNYVRRKLGANRKIAEFIEANNRRWRSCWFQKQKGVAVVTATHHR